MKQKKNPGYAVLLSAFIPGMGQLYNGDWGKAVFFLLTWITLVTWPFAVTDAWDSAERINQQAYANAMKGSPNRTPARA